MGSENDTPDGQDFTKTRRYAILDLTFKGLSAGAIALLGVAGWALQCGEDSARHKDERRKETVETQARAERKYLPTLRSIAEVDLVLVETSADYSWPKHTLDEANEQARLGGHLAYLGSALFFPDGEPIISVVTAEENAIGKTDPRPMKVPARSAVLMLANLLRLEPFLLDMDRPNIAVRVTEKGELRFSENGKDIQNLTLDPRAVGAWRAWLPASGMPLHTLLREVDIDSLADELHAELGYVAENVIMKDPEVLSPECVRIRDEVLRSRDQLLPRR